MGVLQSYKRPVTTMFEYKMEININKLSITLLLHLLYNFLIKKNS